MERLEEDPAHQNRDTCLVHTQGSMHQSEWRGIHVFNIKQAFSLCIPSLLKQEINKKKIEAKEA
jgi:hypothetical protein